MNEAAELTARKAFLTSVALAAIVADGAVLFFAVEEWLAAPLLLLLHCAISATLAALAFARRDDPETWSALSMLALWTFFAGPLGALVGSSIALASDAGQAEDYGEWFERCANGEADRVGALKSALRSRRLRIEGASAVKSLRDVIADGSIKEKLDALNVLGRRFDPLFFPALQLARSDPDQSVRVLAATVTIKLQTGFSSEIEALQATAHREQKAEAWLALADAHARLAVSGLLPPTEAKEHFQATASHSSAALECAQAEGPDRLRSVEQTIHAMKEKWRLAHPSNQVRGLPSVLNDRTITRISPLTGLLKSRLPAKARRIGRGQHVAERATIVVKSP